MESKIYQTNPINIVFGDSNLLLSILSFLYEKTDRPHDFLTNTPIALHILSFKSLYHEFHKFPNLQIQSYPSHYISSLSVFQWAIDMGYNGNLIVDEDLLNLIVHKHKYQSIHFIDYIISQSYYYSCYHIADYATTYGHLHLLEKIKLDDPTFEWDNKIYIENAASGGYLHIIQWICDQDPPCTWSQNTWVAAAKSGHLHILQWLYVLYSPCLWNDDDVYQICYHTIESGHLHILQWLYEKKLPWFHKQYSMNINVAVAVMYGHLHILQWLRSQNTPYPWWCSKTCTTAAQYGRA
jgi:hypothetical protein